MKKILMALVVGAMLWSPQAVDASTNSTLLGQEEKIQGILVEALAGTKDYNKLANTFSEGLAKNLEAKDFTKLQKKVIKELGSIEEYRLLELQKFAGADRLIYLVKTSENKIAELVLLFAVKDTRAYLHEITLRPTEIKK